jgi:hypothetical protein
MKEKYFFFISFGRVRLELALEELVDDTLTVDLEGLGEGVEVEGAGEGVSQTERKHERDPAAGILERPAPAFAFITKTQTSHHR